MSNRMVILASYGNDSVALITWLWMKGFTDATILFNDTGWANRSWLIRVSRLEKWAESLGFTTARTASIGMEDLVKKRKGWPRQGMQFCTMWLKIIPTCEWLDANDPDGKALCVVGVRRSESRERATFPELNPFSEPHGDRHVWAPLVDFNDQQRNALLAVAGIDVLPHRSMECSPCVNANRADLIYLNDHPEDVERLNRIELELGYSSKGSPRVMFRPYKKMGAVGIIEVMKWANAGHGKYEKPSQGCDTGWCGS